MTLPSKPSPAATRPTVAILGASQDRTKFGNKSVRAHLRQGYDVYPVNPRAETIEGLKVYPRLADIPVDVDRVSVYLPPAIGLEVLGDIAAKGCKELWLNPGSDAAAVVEKARRLGLDPIVACSILDLGAHPSEFGV